MHVETLVIVNIVVILPLCTQTDTVYSGADSGFQKGKGADIMTSSE